MPFGYTHSWLQDDDELDRYNKPGSPDWFDLSDEVSFDKPNNRHDALKVESLLGYGGYLDLDKGGGAMGLGPRRLEEPLKAFQEKNGLKVDGLLKPGGPTITKMKQLYGKAFAGSPAPTPAMMDVQAELIDEGKDGFIYGAAPKPLPRPNKRLDTKTDLFDYERWNDDWARNATDPASFAPEYESYIRQIEPTHGHDPGLIYARDFAQKVEKRRGKGGEFVQSLLARLADRPDLQREFLGGAIPHHPPQGTFRPGGETGVKDWIDQDRIANGKPPKYSKAAQASAQVLRASSGATPAPQATEPDPKNLLEYGQKYGLPEDWALQQQQAQRQILPEDGLPPDHQSPDKPTPSEQESLDVDGESNSRRQPTNREVDDAARDEREMRSKCLALREEIREAAGTLSSASHRLVTLEAQRNNLRLELAALREGHGAPPVHAPRPGILGPHRDQQRPPSGAPQAPPSSGSPSLPFPGRGGRSRPPGRPSNPPAGTPSPRPPEAGEVARQGRDAAVFREEYRQWEEKEAAIQAKSAELQEVEAELPAAHDAKQSAQASFDALQRRSESMGCDRFSASRSSRGAGNSANRQ